MSFVSNTLRVTLGRRVNLASLLAARAGAVSTALAPAPVPARKPSVLVSATCRRLSTTANDSVKTSPNVDAREVAKFSRMAAEWWDPHGTSAPLHQMNPTRMKYVRDRLLAHVTPLPAANSAADTATGGPLSGLRILDLGCGGGLVSEALARMGARVVGVDAARASVEVARAHARDDARLRQALDDGRLVYECCTAEELVARGGERFDAVVSLEVVEHIPDPRGFIASASALVREGGALILSTINRTPISFLGSIVAAEWVLRWVPRGTHEWHRFITPNELRAFVTADVGMRVVDTSGLVYHPLGVERWRLDSSLLEMNYIMTAVREPAPASKDAPSV